MKPYLRAFSAFALLALAASVVLIPTIAEGQGSALPGMPPVTDPRDIYSETRPGKFSPAVKNHIERIYVPNAAANVVDVIDPRTFKVIDTFPVGREPQHVTPSWDFKSLWVLADLGDTLTRIDPVTGRKGETIHVTDPYNMYYTPNGKWAIVVCERLRRLDFYDPQTMKLHHQVPVPCKGVDHMDFTADGRQLIASCEFSGELVKVDVENTKVLGVYKLPVEEHQKNHGTAKKRVHHGGGTMPIESPSMPQDVKTSPDGKLFYVADMMADGVHVIDPVKFTRVSFIPTGLGAHGLYPSRDSKFLYVSNRDAGTVSVVDFGTNKIVKTWTLPGGGSPDMGGVSADGRIFWLSGRYHEEVYGIDTTDGHLVARIKVHRGPHGLCVWPQPGRYSLGHTGNLR